MSAITHRNATLTINGEVIQARNVSISMNPKRELMGEDWRGRRYESPVTFNPVVTIDHPHPDDVRKIETLNGSSCVALMGPKQTRWKFPEDRFIQYDEQDEGYCRYFGIGKQIEVRNVTEIPNAHVDYVDTKTITFVGQVVEKEVEVK